MTLSINQWLCQRCWITLAEKWQARTSLFTSLQKFHPALLASLGLLQTKAFGHLFQYICSRMENENKNLRLKNIAHSIASMIQHTLSLVSYPVIVAHYSLSVWSTEWFSGMKQQNHQKMCRHLETKYAHLRDKSEDFSEKKDEMSNQNKVLQSKSLPEKLRKWVPEVEGHTLLGPGTKKFETGWCRRLLEDNSKDPECSSLILNLKQNLLLDVKLS